MSELVPPKQAAKLQNALLDYLTTTFALSDADAQRALDEFLRDPDEGIFKGPYLRTRMPFAPAPRYSADELEWMPENFTPYGHQARAFTRLNSALGRPRPTLVTTGTGSGKTEAFLLPVLDHVIRARRNGVTGVKGLILYPMNALANDQAQRLAHLISTDKQLAEVTAAIYTGENGATRTIVSKDGLITDRTVIRDDAPDILLTNYKMLDQLLLRHEDQHIWQQSAESLQYLVLDEFHTYDGAQGTDVAMLLRRLGLALKSYWPERGSKADTHTTEEWDRPLGKITPVGTSATLGTTPDISKTANQSSSGERSGDMAAFATTVFGEPFDTSCVVTEFRKTIDEWAGDAQKRLWDREIEPRTINALIVNDLVNAVTHRPSDEVCATLLTSLYEGAEGLTDRDDLVLLAKGHPFIRQFLEATTEAIHVRDLADRLLPGTSHENDPRVTFLLELLGALGHLRALPDRDMPSTETHLWIRELSRIDRDVSTATHFRWSDDGTVLGQTTDDGTEPEVVALPAVYCRRCGRSGWGVQLASTGNNLSENNDSIRRTHAAHDGRFRALLSAPREGASAVDTGEATASLRWFDTVNRCLDHHIPDADSPKYRNGVLLPVLTQVGNDADEDAKDDVCPSCGAKDAIRFQGAAIATLLSVCLSTLFGSDDFDEKKALVFTDSVQDAAHRAGFISSRSHALTLRTILRGAIGEEYATIPQLIQGVLDQAGDDQFKRYRLLPTELAEQKNFRDFWRSARYRKVPKKTLSQVRNRVAFDAILELGLQSRYGRTLEQTGSICVEVNAGTPAQMAAIGRSALGHSEDDLVATLASLTDDQVVSWVRGILERIRIQGGINHPWLHTYLEDDGARWHLWGGRKEPGMPAFPYTRSAPAFPRVGGQHVQHQQLDNVTDGQSWYARWTGRVLGVSAGHGARLVRSLLECLHRGSVLEGTATKAQATVYAIPNERIMVRATRDEELRDSTILLRCDLCQAVHPGSPATVRQLTDAPCLNGNCSGHLAPAPMAPDNFYRTFYSAGDPRRIVAREHTSMLTDKRRLKYENGFKDGSEDPSAPNVLVATPTLEMGIDIGDLSTVFLSSLPHSVANYVQRVGRAGRATGSALDVTMVRGRGEHLPRLGDPASMINGQVRPPATYLSAVEILRRQYLAHLGDELTRASAAIKRDESRIDDTHEERTQASFAVAPAADIDPSHIRNEWYVQHTEFGAQYLDRMDLRWINLGKETPSAPSQHVAGVRYHAPLFRICEGCGHLDRTTGTNDPSEHRPWCRYRNKLDEHVRTVALTRSLTTQAVVLPLPRWMVAGDVFALPSLRAALLLGLREQFGGTPNHLGVMPIKEPVGGGTRDALLLHDLVPGGTGYLAEFNDPQKVWDALRHAFQIVRDCPCKDEERLACHRCLLPLAPAHEVQHVSRAKAEDCLKVLMGLVDDDEPEAQMTWKVTTKAPSTNPSDESYLESRFRESFITLAHNLHARISQSYGPGGNVINVSIGKAKYTLQPQLPMHGCKPDFVLRGGDRPDLAIFTDGETFHATPAHNRVRDDAKKRAALRSAGIEVLAVTLTDVKAFDSRQIPVPPRWFNSSASSMLIGTYNYTSDAVRAVTGGPFALLEYWMSGKSLDALEGFASAIPFFFSTGEPDDHVDPSIPADNLQQRGLPKDRTAPVWWSQNGPLSIRTRLRASSPRPATDVCVVLDDDAVSSPDFSHAWHQWLALSNALILRRPPDQTVIRGTQPLEESPAEPTHSVGTIDITQTPWPTVIENLGSSLATPELPGLLEDLAAQGVSEPTAGEEIGSEGIMVDLAWPESRIAVIFAPEPDHEDLLAEDGWTLVPPTAHDITMALANTTEGEGHHG